MRMNWERGVAHHIKHFAQVGRASLLAHCKLCFFALVPTFCLCCSHSWQGAERVVYQCTEVCEPCS
jgi:hypothetical protein